MSGKPEIKLFNWKSAVMATLAGVAGASYRTYQSYQQNGHLSSVDLGVTAITTTPSNPPENAPRSPLYRFLVVS